MKYFLLSIVCLLINCQVVSPAMRRLTLNFKCPQLAESIDNIERLTELTKSLDYIDKVSKI